MQKVVKPTVAVSNMEFNLYNLIYKLNKLIKEVKVFILDILIVILKTKSINCKNISVVSR